MYVHLEDNRLRVRVMCRHAHACSTRIRIYNHNTFAYLRYAYICTTRVVTEGSDCVGRRVRILGHTYLSMYVCVCMCVWNSWCTRLHRGIAQPKGEHSRGSSWRAVQASCYDFQNGEAQWPRSAPDKIVIIIVLAMAEIEERYTRELVRVCVIHRRHGGMCGFDG